MTGPAYVIGSGENWWAVCTRCDYRVQVADQRSAQQAAAAHSETHR